MATGPVTYTEKGIEMHRAVRAAGYALWQENDVWLASDPVAVQAIIDAFDPVAGQRDDVTTGKLRRLRDAVEDRFTLFNIADRGTATTVTAAQFGSYCAAVINNYRTKKAALQAATTKAQLDAVDLTTGWPSNP